MSLQFFIADDGNDGSELWVTNGTSAGTFLLKDINPGLAGSGVGNLVQSNGIMYFTAYDGSAYHLWRSDGTSAGTYALSSTSNGDNASNLINVNGTLYYLGSDSVHGTGLFKSDGTVGGTTFVQTVSNTSAFIAVGNTLFFQAYDATNGYELWKSDGTAAGTGLLKDIMPGGGSSSLDHFTSSGGKLYFTADDGVHGNELWVSDGTAAGTFQIKDINLGASASNAANLYSAGGKLIFTANDGAHGTQLYATDGTAAGTHVLAVTGYSSSNYITFHNQFYFVATDPSGGRAIFTTDGTDVTKLAHLSSFSGKFYNLGSTLIFQGNDGTHGSGLYTFDGTTTTFTGAIPGGLNQPVVSNGKLFFVSYDAATGYELWVSDGTAAGTHITADINPGSYDANITNISAVGTGVVFTATRPDVGTEVFFSDGTQAGTGLLSDVNATGNHSPYLNFGSNFFAAGGKVYFAADDNIHGYELWVGDGTAAGTHMVTDLVVGASSSGPQSFYSFGGKIYYTADDGVNGRQLYVSDGTAAGTLRLSSASLSQPINDSHDFFTLGGHLYYYGYAPAGGYAIFTTDGTVSGTTSVTPVNYIATAPITLGGSIVFYGNDGIHPTGLYSFNGTALSFVAAVSDYEEPVVSGGKLFFRSNDGGNGSELWVYDGTSVHLTADINPGSYDASPTNITSLGNGSVVFSAYNPTTGTELYVSDGTVAGTKLVSDVNPTGNHGPYLSINSDIYAAGGRGFFAADDGIHGNELWVGDGTVAGSHMVTDAIIGASGINPSSFYAFGGKIYYTADDGVNGRQLYVSDGTAAGTLRLSSAGLDQPINDSHDFFTLGGHLYYYGYAAAGGYAIFTTDGTVAGTTSVTNVNYIATVPIALGGSIVFYGNDGTHPNGLYSFNGTALNFIAAVSDYEEPVASGSNLFFRSNDGGNGSELWVYDGTSVHLTADINPGNYDATPLGITSLGNGSVVFTAYSPSTGYEVYVSNGTAAGTTLIADVNTTGNHGVYLSINSDIYATGTKGFFAADDGIHGNELWVGDGTVAGSHMVTDAVIGASGINPSSFYAFGGKIYYTADDGVNGRQLYVSDGTAAGTLRLSSASLSQPINDSHDFFTLGGHLYYYGYAPAGGYAIFTTDGTVAGTTSVTPVNYIATVPIALGGGIVFYGNDGTHPNGLYSFDGTALSFIAAVSDYEEPVVSGGNLFFRSNDAGNGSELWVYDGATSHLVKEIAAGSNSSTPIRITSMGNGSVIFAADDGVHGGELYVSDGTASGTKLLGDLFPDGQGSDPQSLTLVGTKVFFTANYFSTVDGAHGRELFVTDGTVAGTTMIKDILPGSGDGNPNNLFASNGKLFFSAYDGISGYDLWISDGTTAGTHKVPAGDASDDANPGNFIAADATHFFFTGNSGLFYSDGTSAGTHLVGSSYAFDPSYASVVNGTLLYRSYDSTNGYELWKSDGTAAGTARLTDTLTPNSSGAGNFTFAGGKVFFTANDGVHGQELYVTGGTSATTMLVKDINTGGDSNPTTLFVSNGKLFFSAYDGGSAYQLWTSDGTAAGTQKVLAGDGNSDDNPGNFIAADATHFFFTGNSGLFYSDGTTAGTHFVGTSSGFDQNYAGVVNGTLLYRAYDPVNGYELWKSDGTVAGTSRVTDTLLPNSSSLGSFTFVGGKVFFLADDGTHGRELFVTDGTTAGTSLVKDINPAGGSSDINQLFAFNGKLFLSAHDDVHGYQLWVSDGTAAGTTVIGTSDASDDGNPGNFIAADATHFFFTGNSGLFYSDGTSAGTHFVGSTSGFDFNHANVVGGVLYYQSYDPVNGYEMWKSDGTAAGTMRITDTLIPNSSNPGNFAAIDNVPPTVTGTTTVSILDNVTTHPFAGVTIGDADTPVQTMAVTITLDDPAKGGFTAASLTASGFIGGGVAGSYTFTGTAAQATIAIETLIFAPTENRLLVGDSETTTFTVTVNDGAGGSVVNHLTTVTATSANDAPTLVADSAAVNEDATASTSTRAAGVLGNDSDADVGETATIKVVGAHFGAASDTAVAATGQTNIVGTYGTLHLAADGTYNYTPNSAAAEALPFGQTGSDVFSYTVADVHGATTASTLTFNITGQEDGPVAVADTVAVSEDVTAAAATRTGGLLGNDTDVDSGEQATLKITGAHFGAVANTAVAASGVTDIAGTYGTLHLAADGTYSYTPNSAAAEALPVGQAASDVFSYTITDAQGQTSTSTATFNITGVNDAPAPVANTASVNEDATASAGSRATGLLGNDIDVDSGETATLKVVGAHVGAASDTVVAASGTTDIVGIYGTLHLAADGTYSYTPNSAAAEALTQGQAASDVFSYTVADVHGATTASTLSFNITGQNDGPVAVADIVAVSEDVLATSTTRGTGLLGNDSDVDSGETATLKVGGAHFGVAADMTVASSGMTDIVGTYGTLHLAADGTYSYTPNSAAAEALPLDQAVSDIFSYTIVDAQGASAISTVTFNVTGQNDGPAAIVDVTALNEDGTAAATTRGAGLLGNDSDVDAGETATLKVTGAHIGGATDTAVAASVTTNIVGTYGTLHLAADGTYSYTANSGAAEALTQGQAASDVFSYTVADVHGASTTSTLTFNLTGQNDAPVAVADAVAVNEDVVASAVSRATGLLGNDSDVDTGETATLKITGAHVGAASDTAVAASSTTDIVGTYGTLHLAVDGTYSYTPNNGAAEALTLGQAASDVFSYTIADVHGASSTSTLTFNITGQNDGPAAVSETVGLNEDLTASADTRAAGLLGNDSDVDSGETATLKVTGAHVGGASDTAVAATGTTDIVGTYGTLHLAADGTYSYTPNNDAAEALTLGQAASDVFSYTIADVHGASSTSTLTFNITGQNDGPAVVAEMVAINEDVAASAGSRAAGLLGNDSDVDSGETATLKVTGAHAGAASETAVAATGTTDIVGAYGTLHLAADGTYSYTPNNGAAEALTLGQAASDVFSYTVADVHGASSTSTLTFNITGQNDGPMAVADTAAVNEDLTASAGSRAAGLLGNDSDVDSGETATLKITGAHAGAASDTAIAATGTTDIVGTYGTLHLGSDGTYSYTPNSTAAEALTQGQAASEVFSYTVADVHGASTTSTLTFNITGQNDGPVAVGETVAVNEDATASVGSGAAGLLANDSDVDSGETTTLKITGAHVGAANDTVVAASGTTDIVGTYGTLHLAADGTYNYTPESAAAEALPQGQAASDVFSYTVTDIHGASTTSTLTFNITGVDDAPAALDDGKGTLENAAITGASVFGNDHDVDGPLQVGAVNGSSAAVGTQITLASGALLTLRADGTYDYNPNHAFDSLTGVSGATNHTATDSFTYTLVGGNSAIVTITVTGVSTTGDQALGTAGADTMTGTGNSDYFNLSAGGDDSAYGGNGDDAFYLGAAFTAADHIDGGGGANDQIGLQGNYTGANKLVLGVDTIAGIELIGLLTGYDYDITSDDGNVAAGQVLTLYGSTLGAGDSFTFDGSAETNGSFRIYGGLGAENVTGGAGDDGFYFGRDGRFNPLTDHIDGGAGTNDQLALDGSYTVAISGANVTNVEVLSLLDGTAAVHAKYHITLDDDWTAAGQTHTVYGVQVRDGFTLDASGESNGNIKVYGGFGGDTITTGTGSDWLHGGAGADILDGGNGADTFAYSRVSDSIGSSHDTIVNFDASVDHIDLPYAVSGIDAAITMGTLNAGNFDNDLSAALAGLNAHHAISFTANTGDLAGHIFEVIDTNGIAGYQAGQDMVIELQDPVSPITDPTPFV
jgi:ELWxxDGT repeat protein/VCBS repeat-containing protein